jgi:hypothetical protein
MLFRCDNATCSVVTSIPGGFGRFYRKAMPRISNLKPWPTSVRIPLGNRTRVFQPSDGL